MRKIIIEQSDIEQIPFFKEIIDSKYIEFEVELFLRYLNDGINIDKDKLTSVLLEEAIDAKNSVLSTLYIGLSIGLQNWYAFDIDEYEVDQELEKIIIWSEKFCPQFYKRHSELNLKRRDDHFSIGEYLYFAIQLLSSKLTEIQKSALSYGTYYLIKWCLKNYPEQTHKQVKGFTEFLFVKKTLSPVVNIELDQNLLIIGIKNKFGKFEFFEKTDEISSYSAYVDCRFITSKFYYKYYCLPDEDEFDIPFKLFEKKIFPDEYVDFRVINIDECGSYFYGIALLKNQTWFGYTICILDDTELEIEELIELKGKNIDYIETTFRKWMDDDNDDEQDEND